MKLYVSPLEHVVLLYNISINTERDSGADYTYLELVRNLGDFKFSYQKDVLESALYFCNINHAADEFWHPLNVSFPMFVHKISTHNKVEFDYYYNTLKKEKANAGKKN